MHGHLAVAVPGSVAGLALALERWGTLDLRDAVAPAARLARLGVPVDWYLAGVTAMYAEELARFPEAARTYLRAGRLAAAGGEPRERGPRPVPGARPEPRADREGRPERLLPRGAGRGDRGGDAARRRHPGSRGPRALPRRGDPASRGRLPRGDAPRDAGRHGLRDRPPDAERPRVLRAGGRRRGRSAGRARRTSAPRRSGSRSRTASGGSAIRLGSGRRGPRSPGKAYARQLASAHPARRAAPRAAATRSVALRPSADRSRPRATAVGSSGDCTTQVCAVDHDRTLVSLTHTAVSLFGSKVVVPETGLSALERDDLVRSGARTAELHRARQARARQHDALPRAPRRRAVPRGRRAGRPEDRLGRAPGAREPDRLQRSGRRRPSRRLVFTPRAARSTWTTGWGRRPSPRSGGAATGSSR